MYDNVCKFLAEMYSEDLANWLIGTPIKLTELKPTELSLEPIHADSLIFLQSDNLVLHIEFQTSPREAIPFRMADYRLRGYRRFPNKKMYQVVIYLKPTNSPLVRQNIFDLGELTHRFNVIRLWEQPPDIFLSKPGLLPFAVLTQTENPINLLTQVESLISQIPERKKQSNLTASASILAGLVLDQNTIRTILRSDIMRESVIYQEILAEGFAEGKAEGKAEGIAENRQQMAINLLREGLAIPLVAKVTGFSLEQVEALQKTLNLPQ